MSWQIIEDHDTLTFSRFLPESKLFIQIGHDHGPNASGIFEGTATDHENKIITLATGSTFYEVFDKLRNVK